MKDCFVINLSPVRIAIADLVRTGPETFVVTRINVPQQFRGKGHGSKLLKMVLDAADEAQVTLELDVYASGPLSDEDLVFWYERHGFVENKSALGYQFCRKPKEISLR